MVGFFDTTENDEYLTFMKAAKMLREDCNFHVVTGSVMRAPRSKYVHKSPL